MKIIHCEIWVEALTFVVLAIENNPKTKKILIFKHLRFKHCGRRNSWLENSLCISIINLNFFRPEIIGLEYFKKYHHSVAFLPKKQKLVACTTSYKEFISIRARYTHLKIISQIDY